MALTAESIAAALEQKTLASPFAPNGDVLLSMLSVDGTAYIDADDVQKGFLDYFLFFRHTGPSTNDFPFDKNLKSCAAKESFPMGWRWPCVTLAGVRHRENQEVTPPPWPGPTQPPPTTNKLRRLFTGDVVWLFFMERFGIFKILGALLDDYALKGSLPIEWSASDPAPLVLEVFTRDVKMGISSTVRDRDFTYRRVLGWTSEAGKKLGSDATLNADFNDLFTRFVAAALQYYNEKRLAVAIQGPTGPGKPSVATLTSIGQLGGSLVRSFEPFLYGRNYLNTLNGIVYAIGAMGLVKALRDSIGIPKALGLAHEYLGAAYDILIAKARPGTSSNRFIVHRDLAQSARDILIQLEVVNTGNTKVNGGDLETWLGLVEGKFESYRTAYRVATGVDLGSPGGAQIEQAA